MGTCEGRCGDGDSWKVEWELLRRGVGTVEKMREHS